MSSIVADITTELEKTIKDLFPLKARSKYNWDITKNAHKKYDQIYAVRPGALERVAGTTRTATVDHSFTVILANSFNDSPSSDNELNDRIMALYDDLSELWTAAFRTNFGIQRCLVVSDFSSLEPNIDFENKVVSLEISFTIKYRTEA